jgi:hypothetical protein
VLRLSSDRDLAHLRPSGSFLWLAGAPDRIDSRSLDLGATFRRIVLCFGAPADRAEGDLRIDIERQRYLPPEPTSDLAAARMALR